MNKRIPYGRHFLDEDDIQAVVDVLRHGWLTQGPKIAEFEEAIADYVGAKYAVAASSGTAALHMACAAAGIGKGDIVVTSPNTFVASANCALYVGAKPEFADIDPETLNLDPAALEERCRELGRVKAIIPVHFAGLPCDMAAIKKTADKAGAIVIEDASHALQKGTKMERRPGQRQGRGPIDATRRLVRRLLPGASRKKALFLQRLKFGPEDYRELARVMKLIESRNG